MEFKTRYGLRSRVPTPHGDTEVPIYMPVTDEKGGKKLVQTHTRNISDYVNSFKDVVDLQTVLERIQVTGDIAPLYANPGIYADVTGMPQDFGELQNMILSVHQMYDTAPVSVREKYDTFEKFSDAVMGSTADGNVSDLLNLFKSDVDEKLDSGSLAANLPKSEVTTE